MTIIMSVRYQCDHCKEEFDYKPSKRSWRTHSRWSGGRLSESKPIQVEMSGSTPYIQDVCDDCIVFYLENILDRIKRKRK